MSSPLRLHYLVPFMVSDSKLLPKRGSVLSPGHFIHYKAQRVHHHKYYLCAHSQSYTIIFMLFLKIYKIKQYKLMEIGHLYICILESVFSAEILVNLDASNSEK